MDVKTVFAILGAIGAIIAIGHFYSDIISQDSLVTIQGTVIDEKNNPVAGVLVTVDGQSDITDDRGKYVIQNVPVGAKTIVAKKESPVYKGAIILKKGDKIMTNDIIIHPAMPTPSPTPSAPTPTYTPPVKKYLSEDFESGMPENWRLEIDHESAFYDVIVEPGTSNHVLIGHGHLYIAPIIGEEWEDYSLQVRIMLVQDESGSHLTVRNGRGGYYFIGIHSNGVYICKGVKGVNEEHYELTEGDKYLECNTWYIVKVICRGNYIKVYVDGELVTEYIDDDPLKNGRIGLETLRAEVYYDDVLVEEVD
jgi:hypothetical protein